MKKSAVLLFILFLNAASLIAASVASDEDRTRFVERLYEKKEPGLRSPEEYIALAKKAAAAKYPRIAFVDWQDGVVSYRTYRNAPKEEHEMICVNFAHRTNRGGHGIISHGTFYSVSGMQKVVLLVLMRPDLSKTYVKTVHLKST